MADKAFQIRFGGQTLRVRMGNDAIAQTAAARAEAAQEAAEAARDETDAMLAAGNIDPQVDETLLLAVKDAAGFYGFIVDLLKGLSFAGVNLSNEGLRTTAFQVLELGEGGFAVKDANGYYALFVGPGEYVGDTSDILRRLVALESTGATTSAPPPLPNVEVWAHRGTFVSSLAPENSRDALLYSAKAGFRFNESDARLTSDGEWAGLHDASLNRTCKLTSGYADISGTVNVADISLATLRSTYVLASTKPAQRRPVPTVAEYLTDCREFGIFPIMEIKPTGASEAQIAALFNLCRSILGEGNFGFDSFTAAQLDYVRTLSATTPLYYLHHSGTINDGTAASVCAGIAAKAPAALFMDYTAVTPTIRSAARSAGIPMGVYTPPASAANTAYAGGYDFLTSDEMAPRLTNQNVIWRSYAAPSWSDWSRLGTETDDDLVLAAGETATLTPPAVTAVDFGSYHLQGEWKGAISITGTGIGTNALSNAGDDFNRFNFSRLLVAAAPAITITAGVGGARLHGLRVAVASFD